MSINRFNLSVQYILVFYKNQLILSWGLAVLYFLPISPSFVFSLFLNFESNDVNFSDHVCKIAPFRKLC